MAVMRPWLSYPKVTGATLGTDVCSGRPAGSRVITVRRPIGLVVVRVICVASNKVVQAFPLSASVVAAARRLRRSAGSESVTVLSAPLVATRPDGVVTVVEEVTGDCIPKRGSALSDHVVVVPSGLVCVFVPVCPRRDLL